MARFSELPIGASQDDIYGKAGKIFEEQAIGDPDKYKDPEAFEKAIYYIAEAAQQRDFIDLRGMSTKTIAREMGNYISRWLRNHGSQR
jgi:hypothetical protein